MDGGMEIQIEVSISDYSRGNGSLRLSERVTLRDADFMAMSGILAKFHEALAAVKAAQEAEVPA